MQGGIISFPNIPGEIWKTGQALSLPNFIRKLNCQKVLHNAQGKKEAFVPTCRVWLRHKAVGEGSASSIPKVSIAKFRGTNCSETSPVPT